MSQLSVVTGVSVATIKFYVREGLLPPGRATSATQAEYDDTHVERLRLVRVLREVGEMPLARIDAVLRAIDDDDTDLDDLLGEAHHALGPEPAEHPGAPEIRHAVVEWAAARGWNVTESAPSFDVLAGALVAFRDQWGFPDVGPEIFDEYADAAERIAEHDLAWVDASMGRGDIVRQVIVGTVVFERALVALRRLAQEHFSHQRFAVPTTGRRITSGRAPRSRAATARRPAPGR